MIGYSERKVDIGFVHHRVEIVLADGNDLTFLNRSIFTHPLEIANDHQVQRQFNFSGLVARVGNVLDVDPFLGGNTALIILTHHSSF
ncbi:hypothetical protein D3C78_1377460 [compost metagenome]